MSDDVTSRPITSDDASLLTVATLGNLNWSGERFTEEDVTGRPELRHYTQLVPDRGDFGFVALRAARPIGAVWALFLPAGEPGYGFLDESTPEVSLWVRADSRGAGVGRMLLRRIQEETVARGLPRVSLSVEPGNAAARLYAAEGFIPVPGREADGVMVWDSRSSFRGAAGGV